MRNRYGLDFEQLKSNSGSNLSVTEKAEHVSDAGYCWE